MAKRPKPVNYTPRNPKKYRGSYPIVLRSSWEVRFAQYCDLNEDVLEWASEPVEIPYRNPVKGTQSIYIPDFIIKFRNAKGAVETRLIEIKPEKEALEEKAKNQYDTLSLMVNKAKWLAAAAWCSRRGIKFMTLTESSLFENSAPPTVRKPKKKGIKKPKAATKKPKSALKSKTKAPSSKAKKTPTASRTSKVKSK
jgi:hypothetical protein